MVDRSGEVSQPPRPRASWPAASVWPPPTPALPYAVPPVPTPKRRGSRRVLVIVVIAGSVVVAILILLGLLSGSSGPGWPGAPELVSGPAVPLVLSPTTPPGWAWPEAVGPSGPRERVSVGELTIYPTADASTGDEWELRAVDANDRVVWHSAKRHATYVGLWTDGRFVYSQWRYLQKASDFMPLESVDYLLVVFDSTSGRALWWCLRSSFSDWTVDVVPLGDTAVVIWSNEVQVIDVPSGTTRWHASCPSGDVRRVGVAAKDLRISCVEADMPDVTGYATADLLTGAPR